MDDWLRIGTAFGGDRARAEEIGRDLVARYSEPHRRYHTLTHVHDLLALLGDADVTLLAAVWFHDAVYDTRRTDNEALSAELATRSLFALLFPPHTVDLVARMIAATAKHDAASLPPEALRFLDADLSILGAPAERYREYAAQIREEYAWVPEKQFRAGRRGVLERFLTRPRLYFTNEMSERFEERARENIREEIARLQRT